MGRGEPGDLGRVPDRIGNARNGQNGPDQGQAKIPEAGKRNWFRQASIHGVCVTARFIRSSGKRAQMHGPHVHSPIIELN